MNDFVVGKLDYADETKVHPLGLIALILLGIAMLTLPRRRAMITVLACASFIAVGQRLVIFTLDFNFTKLIILVGWVRVFVRHEYRGFQWNRLDWCIIAWATVGLIAYPFSHGGSGIVWKLGSNYEALGMYFLARMLVRDLGDVKQLVFDTAIISIPVTCIFLVEAFTSRNLFAVLGGVPEITEIREGRLRCQGAYSHPILAGCFWAAIVPLLIGRIFSGRRGRGIAIVGLFASLAIIVMCRSSTPIIGLLAAGAGFAAIPLRNHMWVVRWSILLILCSLNAVMQVPVWFLVGRTDLVGGSTGWHRAHLIDQAIKHFSDWAVCGVDDIRHWNVFGSDITNHYILEAVRGGVLTLGLFLLMICFAFGNAGRMRRSLSQSGQSWIMAWAIGVSFLVHIVNFVGVSYFGQIDLLWFLGLAMTTVVPIDMTTAVANTNSPANTSQPAPTRPVRARSSLLDSSGKCVAFAGH